jgi:DNA-binding MarR family transcriptional regulator
MQKEIYTRLGKKALGSRLRLLTAKITEDAEKLYGLYGVELAPKWFPVFYVLSEYGEKTITDIANDIGHTQPSVSKIIREMNAAGLVEENRSTTDKRKNVVALTEKGNKIKDHIADQYLDVDAAIDQLIRSANHNLWEAIEEWEFLLEQKSLFRRVVEEKKHRERKAVEIVEYTPRYQSAFKLLNQAWIEQYFVMEEADHKALDDPQKGVLDGGGAILVALYKGAPVGVCALVKMDDPDYDYELAKMAVSPKAQGKGIGGMLGEAVIRKAQKLGARTLYLESNTVLEPAIRLYYKLGFKKVVGRPTPYERCNIQMELELG